MHEHDARNVLGVERHVLEAALDHGQLGFLNGKQSDATEALLARYPKDAYSRWQITQVVNHLVDVQCLTPTFNTDGERIRPYAGGITPKGYERLRQLQHPQRYWAKSNWFPLFVAASTSLLAVVDVLMRLGLIGT